MNTILKEDGDKRFENENVNGASASKKPEENFIVNEERQENNSKVQNTDIEPNGKFECMIEKELRRQGITMNDLTYDNPRLSLDWQTFRGFTQCLCAAPIDSLTRKVRCFSKKSVNMYLTIR